MLLCITSINKIFPITQDLEVAQSEKAGDAERKMVEPKPGQKGEHPTYSFRVDKIDYMLGHIILSTIGISVI